MSIERVAVLGGGLMGSGIAKSLGHAVERGKVSEDEAAAIHARIDYTAELPDVAEADLLLQPGAGDESGRGRRRPRHLRGDRGHRPRSRRSDREARGFYEYAKSPPPPDPRALARARPSG
jgi:hypothetical protein